MELLEQLEQEAFDRHLRVVRMGLAGDVEALIIDDTVCIKNELPIYRGNTLLAHEIEHAETCPYNLVDAPRSTQEKYESIANRNAIKKLVPIDKIIKLYFRGYSSPEEYAEYLEVDVQFFKKALELYHGIYGFNYKYKGFIITFSPLNIIG